ncbi:MAG TPA: alpha/beta hydrolase [Nevskiaceae bacterium]|nr:alpha/beta hydrolase [Nevskiaceae bacterium]
MNDLSAPVGAVRSEFLQVRGLRYHLRHFGAAGAPKVFLLHGFLDCSATWVEVGAALGAKFHVIAPDMRGFGETQWTNVDYWFPDYVADLDGIVQQIARDEPLRLVGHSMGAQIASLYAGFRPERVAKLVILDGLFLPDMPAEIAPKRGRKWLNEVLDPPKQKYYASFEELAERIRKKHPQLSNARSLWVARGWGRLEPDGRIGLCADPMHRMSGPGLYKAAESAAIWREITAETLFVDAEKSVFAKAISKDEKAMRRACFRNMQEAEIAGAGHMLNFDAPEETAKAILGFL